MSTEAEIAEIVTAGRSSETVPIWGTNPGSPTVAPA